MLIGIDGNEANLSRRVGVNQYAFDLLHELRDLDTPHRFRVYLKAPPLPDMPAERPGWEYRVIPFPVFWTRTRLPLDLYIERPRPDVFFTPSHYSPHWSPVPTVISVMDVGFLDTPGQFTARDFHQLKNWTADSVKKAARIIAISEYTRRDIVSHYARREEDITVTYPGYDRHLFRPVKDAGVLAKYAIKKPYILFLSSLKPSKNVEGLIRAFKDLNRPGLQLVIAGKKAWLYERIFALTRELGLESRVIFTGFVEETEVPVLMSGASAYILPSFHEGFGIPVVEAMACGTPVVVSRVASLPEVAADAGIYVGPDDPADIARGIRVALGKSRASYIRKGLSRASFFSWSRTARQTLEVLESAKDVK